MKTAVERCPGLAKINVFGTYRRKEKTIGFDLAETLRNETFELYLDVGFDYKLIGDLYFSHHPDKLGDCSKNRRPDAVREPL